MSALATISSTTRIQKVTLWTVNEVNKIFQGSNHDISWDTNYYNAQFKGS